MHDKQDKVIQRNDIENIQNKKSTVLHRKNTHRHATRVTMRRCRRSHSLTDRQTDRRKYVQAQLHVRKIGGQDCQVNHWFSLLPNTWWQCASLAIVAVLCCPAEFIHIKARNSALKIAQENFVRWHNVEQDNTIVLTLYALYEVRLRKRSLPSHPAFSPIHLCLVTLCRQSETQAWCVLSIDPMVY